jgi:hypothetical protein
MGDAVSATNAASAMLEDLKAKVLSAPPEFSITWHSVYREAHVGGSRTSDHRREAMYLRRHGSDRPGWCRLCHRQPRSRLRHFAVLKASWNYHDSDIRSPLVYIDENTWWQRRIDHNAVDASRDFDAIQQRQSGQGVLAPGLGWPLDPDRCRFDPRSPCHLRSDIWPQHWRGHTRWVPAN